MSKAVAEPSLPPKIAFCPKCAGMILGGLRFCSCDLTKKGKANR